MNGNSKQTTNLRLQMARTGDQGLTPAMAVILFSIRNMGVHRWSGILLHHEAAAAAAAENYDYRREKAGVVPDRKGIF